MSVLQECVQCVLVQSCTYSVSLTQVWFCNETLQLPIEEEVVHGDVRFLKLIHVNRWIVLIAINALLERSSANTREL